MAVQINGKVRDTIVVSKDASRETIEEIALATEKMKRQLEGKTPRKVIVVPGRIVNVVI